jgi:predicted PurR-regulated permease PerM
MLQTPLAIALLLGGALFIVLAGLRLTADLLAPILLAYTLAVALLPLVKRLEHKLPRSLALAGVFLTAFLVAALLIGFFMLELQEFARRIPVYQGMLETRFAQAEALVGRWGYNLSEVVANTRAAPGMLTHVTLRLITSLLNATASLTLFLFILITMTLDFPGVSRAFYGHMGKPLILNRQVHGLIHEIQTHFRLQTVSNLLSAGAVTAAYLLFRVDFAILWGLLTFFLSYIPRIGMLLSFIPPVLMAFVQYGIERALALLLVSLMLNGLMDNFITPMLSKKGLGLRASTVLISSLLWLWIFGPLGALLAMPLTLLVRKLLASSDLTLPFAYAMSTDEYTSLPPGSEEA